MVEVSIMSEKMVTFEQIQKANDSVKPIVYKNTNANTGEVTEREYVQVNQRVKAFRMVYPQGLISTEILKLDVDRGFVIIKAHVFNEESVEIANAISQEYQMSSYINKTSYIENAETSAIGRALGFAGFGIDTSIASYEEIVNAQEHRDEEAKKPVKVVEKAVGQEAPTPVVQPKNVQAPAQVPQARVAQQNRQSVSQPAPQTRLMTEKQLDVIITIKNRMGMYDSVLKDRVKQLTGKDTIRQCTVKEASTIINWLQNAERAQQAQRRA